MSLPQPPSPPPPPPPPPPLNYGQPPQQRATASPLTPEQFAQWQAAGVAMRKIRRAAGVATFDGWSIACFAALTWVCGMTDPTTIAIALVMGTVAFVELRAANRLRAVDVTASRTLAFNQFVFAGLLVAYALTRITLVLRGGAKAALAGQLDPQTLELLGELDIDALVRQISLL